MNIVHVVPALTKGGGERVVADLANQAAQSGHSVAILCAVPAPSDQLPTAIHSNVELRLVQPNGSRVKRSYAKLIPWMLANRRWLLEQDIVHVHLTFGAVFATVLRQLRRASGGQGPAIVETYHAVGVPIPKTKRAVHTLLMGGPDAIAFMAEDPFWTAFRDSHSRKLTRTIPNGVAPLPTAEPRAVAAYRDRARIPAHVPLVGTIGRLVPERRPDLLLHAFAALKGQAEGEVHFLLAGEGPERSRLEALARNLGIADRLHMPGLVTNPAEPLALISLYFTINVGPITGIAALEAAFAGVPSVALQLREDYRPSPGDWMWSSNDPVELGRRGAELIADTGSLRTLAAQQQAHVRAHHSVDAMAEAYYRLYEEALALRTQLPPGRS